MSIDVAWYDTKETIILHTYLAVATEKDVLTAARHTWEMIEQRDYPVDLIVDMREVSHHPENIFGFWGKRVDPLVHERQRYLVVLATSLFEQTWLHTAEMMHIEGARNMNICSTMSEAYQKIAELRQTA